MRYATDESESYKRDELFASDAQLLGRVTYEGFAAAWPTITDEQGFADRMNGMAKYVVSTTLRDIGWNNSHLISGDVRNAVAELKRQPGQDILVGGSRTLAQFLAKHGLVDEYHLLVYPIVLGTGKRLFDSEQYATLTLVEARPFASGVVALTYRVPTTT
jgi:dihydrofolate reductase